MSRSRHHGCGRCCGLCRPHKRWREKRLAGRRPGVRLAEERAALSEREQLTERPLSPVVSAAVEEAKRRRAERVQQQAPMLHRLFGDEP